jgi:hypothetical protein
MTHFFSLVFAALTRPSLRERLNETNGNHEETNGTMEADAG